MLERPGSNRQTRINTHIHQDVHPDCSEPVDHSTASDPCMSLNRLPQSARKDPDPCAPPNPGMPQDPSALLDQPLVDAPGLENPCPPAFSHAPPDTSVHPASAPPSAKPLVSPNPSGLRLKLFLNRFFLRLFACMQSSRCFMRPGL